MRYRKKPVIIEAVQYFGSLDTNTGEWPKWLVEGCFNGTILVDANTVHIKTMEGVMRVSDGDWIIKGIQGELYPCKPDIFAATYEPVPEEPAHPREL